MPLVDDLPVVVIGAGPVGLAAAAHLIERDLPVVILEGGDSPAASVRQWSHVRLFSPWRYNIDDAARRLLAGRGWVPPNPDTLPTGAGLIADYLMPLAAHPAIAQALRIRSPVVAMSRVGFDRVRSQGRSDAPFVLRLSTGDELLARGVIDASGTWATPNVLGANGIPALGETDPQIAERIVRSLPDVTGAQGDRFAGRHTIVVGAGHSAATTLLELARLAEVSPDTRIMWAIRAGTPRRAYGGGKADALPARGALGLRLRELVDAGQIDMVPGFFTQRITRQLDGSLELVSRDPSGLEQKVVADLIVAATGFRPDHSIASELRLDVDPALGSTRALAPLIDPNHHSCGTVPPHGVDELAHPETGYYAIGSKSYGRAPTFLLATGYEQARSVVAALAGDWTSARDVQLVLPETGVCSSNLADVAAPSDHVRGGDRTPLPLLSARLGSCCG